MPRRQERGTPESAIVFMLSGFDLTITQSEARLGEAGTMRRDVAMRGNGASKADERETARNASRVMRCASKLKFCYDTGNSQRGDCLYRPCTYCDVYVQPAE